MTREVDFIFDFASPNAYFAYQLLDGISERTGAQFNIVPALLGGIFKLTGNQSPMVGFSGVKGKLEYQHTETVRFIKKNRLRKFKMNSNFPVNTLMLMRGAIVALDRGFLNEYVTVCLAAMWEQDKKMDDPEVFVAVMNEAGFNAEQLLEGTSAPEVKAKLMANTEAAVARGAFGIPTFYVGDEMFFGKDRLDQLEAEILSQA